MSESILRHLGRRRDLPTYLGGWLACVAWLQVVGTTVGDAPFNVLIYLLTTFGFLVSFWLRGFEDTPQAELLRRTVLVPSTVLRLLFMAGVVLGLLGRYPFVSLVPDLAMGNEEWMIGTGFMWAMALYSFGLLSDGLIAFSSVLGLSMLGLMASENVNPEVGLAFLAFLLGNTLMLSNMTLAHHSSRRREGPSGRALARWLVDQLMVAALTVAVTSVLAIGGAVVLARVTPKTHVPRMRLPSGLARSGVTQGGFAAFEEQMRVGVGGAIPTTPVFRARVATPQLWRRRVYDAYNGLLWTAGLPGRSTVPLAPGERVVSISSNLETLRSLKATRPVQANLTWLADGDLVAPALAVRVTTPLWQAERSGLEVDRYGNVLSRVSTGQAVTVESRVMDPTPEQLRAAPPVAATEWVQLLKIPASARDLALRQGEALATGQSTPYDIAAAIQNWLETSFTYDALVAVPARANDPLEHFFTVRRGACDLIATAMALLARANGIPARVAVGYGPGTLEPDGGYLVRMSDAHAWAELYFTGYGWVAFNPHVPGPADAQAAAQAQAALRGVRLTRRNVLLGLCGLLAVWLGQYVLRHWRRSRPRFTTVPEGEIERRYYAAQRLLARRRLGRRPSETAAEHLARLRQAYAAEAWLIPLESLTRLFEQARYRFTVVQPADVTTADAALKALQRTVPRRRKNATRSR